MPVSRPTVAPRSIGYPPQQGGTNTSGLGALGGLVNTDNTEGPRPNPTYVSPPSNNTPAPPRPPSNAQIAYDLGNPNWAPGPGDQVFGGSAPPVPARDFFADARALYPWLPDELLRVFAEHWAQSGDSGLALAYMRQAPSYDTYFPGNRRQDGSYRLSEQEYLATIDGYETASSMYDLNPQVFLSPEKRRALIEGDVSAREFNDRLDQAYNELINFGPEGVDGISYTQRYFSEVEGITLSDTATFAAFVDPSIEDDILNRKVSIAQIGGGAMSYGFRRNRQRIERIMGEGVNSETGLAFYRGASAALPQVQALARRFNNQEGVDVETLEDIRFFGDEADRRRLAGNVRQEQVSFFGRETGRRDDEGRVFGLGDR